MLERTSEPRDESGIREAAPLRLLVLLIALTAIGPMSLNILIPAVPALGRAFKADAGLIQLTLSLYLLGMATSQLVLGPLSDRFGRRPVILGGLMITITASLAAALATSIDWLIAARTVQALGASAGVVISRAIIRDLYDRDRAASMIGWVTMAMIVAPMISPLIGGALDVTFGWPSIFAFVALYAAIALAVTVLTLPETRAIAISTGAVRFLEEMAALATDRTFVGYALCAACSSAMFFAFLGGAPHIVVTMMGRSSAQFGLWFAFGAAAYMSGNFIAARWSARYGVDAMIKAGIALAIPGAIIGVAWVLMRPDDGPVMIFLPQMIASIGSGFLLPNSIAGAVSVRPQAAGAAAGITGFLQMSLGAVAVQIIGNLLEHAATALPMTIMVAIFAVGMMIAFFGLVRR